MEGPENHRSKKKDTKAVENLSVNLTRPQDLSRWKHLNGVQSPKIGEEVTLLIGANVPEAQIHEDVLVGRAGEPYAVRAAFGPCKNESPWLPSNRIAKIREITSPEQWSHCPGNVAET